MTTLYVWSFVDIFVQSIDSSTTVVPPDQENIVKIKSGYTPPIIIMLPEDPTSREKWEYAVTLKCLGQKNFDVFTDVHNTRMAKMMAIKGKTVEEIQEEIKETEKEIKNVKSDLESAKKVDVGDQNSFKGKTKLLHKNHNIKLINREIDILNVKLERLQKRLKSAILFGRRGTKGISEKNNEEEEEEKDDESSEKEESNFEEEEEKEGEEGDEE